MELDRTWFKHEPGRRGFLLLILGCQEILYGTALINSTYGAWWPASKGELAGISVDTWGIIWIGFGIFLFTGIYLTRDKYQFAAAMFLNSLWGMLAFYFAVASGIGGLWGPASTYIAISTIVLLSSGWRVVK